VPSKLRADPGKTASGGGRGGAGGGTEIYKNSVGGGCFLEYPYGMYHKKR